LVFTATPSLMVLPLANRAFSLVVSSRCIKSAASPSPMWSLWLGWAYLAKTVRKPQRGGINFDPPMIFRACSMPNPPAASEMPQDDFRTKQKILPSGPILGPRLAVVTSPPYTKT
jgi:hypothetical protein